MTEKEKMLMGLYHLPSDELLSKERMVTEQQLFLYNHSSPLDQEKRSEILSKILGKYGRKPQIKPPFTCDYGYNIEVGDWFFANSHLTILDSGKVTIGDEVLFGPNVGLYTVAHPMDYESRKKGYEIAKPIVIEEGVWLAANVIVLGGVTIGARSVIGAGSVVTKDIPADSFAAGNPCKVIRKIDQNERRIK